MRWSDTVGAYRCSWWAIRCWSSNRNKHQSRTVANSRLGYCDGDGMAMVKAMAMARAMVRMMGIVIGSNSHQMERWWWRLRWQLKQHRELEDVNAMRTKGGGGYLYTAQAIQENDIVRHCCVFVVKVSMLPHLCRLLDRSFVPDIGKASIMFYDINCKNSCKA